jgi:DNA-binding beta-propeller fold protein YncE
MKTSSMLSYANAAVFVFIAGCSSSASPTPAEQFPASTQGIEHGLFGDTADPAKYAGRRDLYVADYGLGKIIILKNHSYAPDGSITTGINGPQGVALDLSGNLYVANRTGGTVSEYAPGASAPSFVYYTDMVAPESVSVDRQGHLFEADVPVFHAPAAVNEFQQGSNVPVHRCFVPGLVGVASDSSGDVFVDYNTSEQGGGRIAEYKGGLAGCSSTVLGAQVYYAGGIVIDNQNNILIADGNAPRVDVIAPPYSSITRSFAGGLGAPLFVSIDRANKNVFVTASRFYHSYVYVVDYATGKKVQRLGYSHGGISIPYGAVDGPSAVP